MNFYVGIAQSAEDYNKALQLRDTFLGTYNVNLDGKIRVKYKEPSTEQRNLRTLLDNITAFDVVIFHDILLSTKDIDDLEVLLNELIDINVTFLDLSNCEINNIDNSKALQELRSYLPVIKAYAKFIYHLCMDLMRELVLPDIRGIDLTHLSSYNNIIERLILQEVKRYNICSRASEVFVNTTSVAFRTYIDSLYGDTSKLTLTADTKGLLSFYTQTYKS